MSNPSVPHTLVTDALIDAPELNRNYTALINAMSDGAADLTVSRLDASGYVNISGTSDYTNVQTNHLYVNTPVNTDWTMAVGGEIHVTGDIYTTPITDYTGTYTGLDTPMTTHKYKYKQVGNLVTVNAMFEATSSDTTVSFTLPVAPVNFAWQMAAIAMMTEDGTGIPGGGFVQLTGGDNTAYVWRSWNDTTSWTADTTRFITTTFTYPVE